MGRVSISDADDGYCGSRVGGDFDRSVFLREAVGSLQKTIDKTTFLWCNVDNG